VLSWLGQGISHEDARRYLTAGYLAEFGSPPSLSVVQGVQAVAWHETNYGAGWRNAGVGSNNWGAIQCGRTPCDPASEFFYTDTHPDSSGGSTRYEICFCKYASPEAGARALVRQLYKRSSATLTAAKSGDLHAFAAAMHAAHYYEGSGRTVEDRIRGYEDALRRAIARFTAALGERVALGEASIIRSNLRPILLGTALGVAVLTFPRWRDRIGL
jgi:hypothetical protein